MNRSKYARYALSLGHLCSDVNQGTLAALLPYLIAAYHFDYATAATLVMVSNIAGSLIQPLFGWLSDQKSRTWVMLLGVCMAGGGMAATGLVSGYGGLCAAVIVSGMGIAMFHPQAALLVNALSTERDRGANLGVFSFGGSMGFTVGPAMAGASIALFGLKGTLVFLLPPLVFAAAYAVFFTGCDFAAAGPKTSAARSGRDSWREFAKLSSLVFARSIVNSGINTFTVLYLTAVHGQSKALSSAFLSVYYAAGAFSSLLGGCLSDRLGHRRAVRLSFCLLLPSLMLFTITDRAWLALALLLPMGIGSSLCFSPLVALGQRYLPRHVGLASGMTLGMAVSVGGIIAPAFGRVGDLYGLRATFAAVSAFAVLPVLISFLLKEPDDARTGEDTPR
ncbi:MAG: MFS transporter [Pyramidobacter sp.]|nr:MFS transporter [Pyramidobacter sp.]